MLSLIKNIGLLEICLIQIIFYSGLWLMDDYLAILMTAVLTLIIFSVLVISLITEWIEKSKVPKAYFSWMIASTIIPIVIAAFFAYFVGVTSF